MFACYSLFKSCRVGSQLDRWHFYRAQPNSRRRFNKSLKRQSDSQKRQNENNQSLNHYYCNTKTIKTKWVRRFTCLSLNNRTYLKSRTSHAQNGTSNRNSDSKFERFLQQFLLFSWRTCKRWVKFLRFIRRKLSSQQNEDLLQCPNFNRYGIKLR